MGMLVKHILNHKSGRRSFLRRFPSELRPFVESGVHKVSLGHEGSAGFLTRYDQAAAEYDRIVTAARRKYEGAYDALDPPRIAYLAKAFESALLEGGEAGLKEGRAEQVYDSWQWLLDDFKEWRREQDFDQAIEQWAPFATRMLEARGLVIDPRDSQGFQALCMAMNDAAISISPDAKAQMLGEVIAIPEPAEPLTANNRAASNSSPVPLLTIFDAYAAAQRLTPNVRDDWRRCIEMLIAFIGHDDAARLTFDMLRDWRDKLLSELSQNGKLRDPRTVRGRYLCAVKATLAWAFQERKLPANVARDVTVRVPKKPKLRDPAFTLQEATAILAATLTPASPHMAPGHALARRWIPWLCAYTGARVNEFSQLRGEDVREIEGIWTVRITPEAGTVKSQEARIIPLHLHLIEQGFLAVLKARGPGPLFYDPDKQRVQTDSNRHFKKVGERLAEWVRKDVGITDPAVQPNHGWRHYFKAMSYEIGIEERMADAIQGHAPSTEARKYGPPSMKARAAAIARIPRFEVTVC